MSNNKEKGKEIKLDDGVIKETKKEEKKEKEEKKSQTFGVRHKVILTKSYNHTMKIREFHNIDCKGAALVEGFPKSSSKGISLAVMTAQFIIEQLDLPLIGDIVCNKFPTLAVIQGGQAVHGMRIYGNKKMVVFLSEYTLGSELSNEMVEIIYDFSRRHRCSKIFTVNTLATDPSKTPQQIVKERQDLMKKIPRSKVDFLKMISLAKERRRTMDLYFYTNDEETSKKLMKLKHKPISDVVVNGISGGIVAESSYHSVTVCCLFSLLDDLHKYISVDAGAAFAIIKCIDSVLGSVIMDLKSVSTNVEKMENDVINVIKKLSSPVPGRQNKSNYNSMYS